MCLLRTDMCGLKILLLVLVVVTVVAAVPAEKGKGTTAAGGGGGGGGGEKKIELPSNCGRFLNYKFFRGNKTELDDYPWLALVEYKTPSGRRALCGGVLISSRYVLTAAHCAFPTDNWIVDSVRLGEYDTKTEIDCIEEGDDNNSTKCTANARSVKVDRYIIHEKFRAGHIGHDLALLRLAEEVAFDDYVQPICLPDKSNSIVQKFQVAGWGILGDRPGSHIKLRSQVTVVNRTSCVTAYAREKVHLFTDQICLGGGPKESVCFADSGGPLMGVKLNPDGSYRMTVFGVFAHYYTFCDVDGWPGIFTDILKYRDWVIHHVLKG